MDLWSTPPSSPARPASSSHGSHEASQPAPLTDMAPTAQSRLANAAAAQAPKRAPKMCNLFSDLPDEAAVPIWGSSDEEEQPVGVTREPVKVQQERVVEPVTEVVYDVEKLRATWAKSRWQPDMRCSGEQLNVLAQIRAGHNVFFSGSAGTGKSFLINQIRQMLKNEGIEYAVTAPTGISALEIGGMTVHRWSKVHKDEDTVVVLANRILRSDNRVAEKRWTETAVLIIDEISMLSPSLWTKLNAIGKLTRQKHSQAFGGMQLVVSGDFFQLPPAIRNEYCEVCGNAMLQLFSHFLCKKTAGEGEPVTEGDGCGVRRPRATFAFETDTWKEANFEHILLTKVYRQTDPVFYNLLEKVRRGVVNEEEVALLKSCTGQRSTREGRVKASRLEPRNKEVDVENEKEYQKLPAAEEHFYAAKDLASSDYLQHRLQDYLKGMRAPTQISLKAGAQVMLLTNMDLDHGLANGSRGVVTGFEVAGPSHFVSYNDRDGMELERRYPRVLFGNGEERVITPFAFTVEIGRERISRTQLPLMLAWAITIHKSQGSTLDAVTCNLEGIKTPGQTYVALSRCRTMAGMRLENFDRSCIKVSPVVKAFYDNLPVRAKVAPQLIDMNSYVRNLVGADGRPVALPGHLRKVDAVESKYRSGLYAAPSAQWTRVVVTAPTPVASTSRLPIEATVGNGKRKAEPIDLIDSGEDLPDLSTAMKAKSFVLPPPGARTLWQEKMAEAWQLFATHPKPGAKSDFIDAAKAFTFEEVLSETARKKAKGKKDEEKKRAKR